MSPPHHRDGIILADLLKNDQYEHPEFYEKMSPKNPELPPEVHGQHNHAYGDLARIQYAVYSGSKMDFRHLNHKYLSIILEGQLTVRHVSGVKTE